MTRFNHALGVCILVGALFQTPAIHAATYYVATTGSNSYPGTEAQPWRTVAQAVNSMVAGDTTFVRGGIYNEGTMQFKRSGTQSAQIKLLNYPGEAPIIHCNASTPITGPFNRIIILNQSGSKTAIGWITIEGFEIRNCWDGLKIHSGHDLTIRRNWFHDNTPGQGILGNGTRILIDRNVISHNGDFTGCAAGGLCNQEHGIYGNGTAWTITNNLIYDNIAFGIQINGSASYVATTNPAPEFALTADWVIANNTIAYQNYQSGIVVWRAVRTSRIENNIFYENHALGSAGNANGIHFLSAGSNTFVQIRNNLSFASGSGGTAFLGAGATEGVHYTQSGNIVNTVNPAFVNAPATVPASPNFALTQRSSAVDAGLSLAEIPRAFDGTTRPQGRAHDIGAYEYKAGSDVNPPAAPILQVR